MPEQSPRNAEALRRTVTRTVAGAIAYLAFVVFGILVIVEGDWVPGIVILGGGIVDWAVLVPVIGRLCREAPAPSPRSGKPAS